jgi:hypothetical protein
VVQRVGDFMCGKNAQPAWRWRDDYSIFPPTRRMCVYGRSAPFSTRSLPLESCVTLEKAQPCRSEGPCAVWLRVDAVVLGDIHMPAGL